jgi:uncharacterized protein (DUF885 family)
LFNGPVAIKLTLCFLLLAQGLAFGDSLDKLASDFWKWRGVEQPISSDDVPRIERREGWVSDWSREAIARRESDLARFENRWQALSMAGQPVARQVDYRLMGSAIERVRWELEITRDWQRNPDFYVQQTLGSIFDALLRPPPFNPERSRQILQRMQAIPAVVHEARANLADPRAPFARLAVGDLQDVRGRLRRVDQHAAPLLDAQERLPLRSATEKAASALDSYRGWLERRLPRMSDETAVGRSAYVFFLKKVALIPFSPEELLEISRQEWARAVAFQAYQENLDRDLPELALPQDQAAQIAREETDEAEVRRFIQAKRILTLPPWLGHYRNLPLPGYLAPLADLGVTDYLVGPDRLRSDAVHYIPAPSPKLDYFDLATALDPRVMIVHEGVPGHYLQLVLSSTNPDPIRRHYYDSGANEGIAFYSEEMMLQNGLFNGSPRSREILYNFMRLRALRVKVDVKLALGDFTVSEAAAYLERNVPMDRATALDEASFFASTPGQAISYQAGKTQILEFLADAERAMEKKFSLRKFHDFVWPNGSVPIALQRWEYLGDESQVKRLDQ